MNLNVSFILSITLAALAFSSFFGLFLIEPLKLFLVPKPRVTFLSDILSFDHILPDNITLLGKDGTLTQTLSLQGVDATLKTVEEIRILLKQKQRWLDTLSELNASFKILTIREEIEQNALKGDFSPILNHIHDAWMNNFKKTYQNRYYLIITNTPKKDKNFSSLFVKHKETANLAKLNELVSITQEILHPFKIKVLNNA